MWKLASMTPILKKGDKHLIKNYRPISLLPICGKILENIIFNLYAYLHKNNLITKNKSGFRPGDFTTNRLLYLLEEIHQAFDSTTSLEVRAIFRDISKAVFRDIPKAVFRDISKAVFRDIPKAVFRDISKAVFRDIPKAVFRDIPKAVFRDIPKAVFRDIP